MPERDHTAIPAAATEKITTYVGSLVEELSSLRVPARPKAKPMSSVATARLLAKKPARDAVNSRQVKVTNSAETVMGNAISQLNQPSR